MLQVIRAKNKSLEGLSGQVIDETRNTMTVMTEKGKKKLIKNQIIIKINNKTIDGKKLAGRIEERLKNQ
ncbi:ribonuclease P protein subunit [Candidatus Woesearchaeota archaeon]|nr:ribonuclease P protein subunit [Candidatus Woesearchaeota archaeon]